MPHRWLFAATALLLPAAAPAKEPVRLVDTQAALFSDYALYIAKREGYFDAENLDASIVVGRGGSDSLQAVVTGTQDIVYGTGILGVISAYAKGAPVVIVANAVYGATDLIWYVKKDSPIRTIKDLDGKEMVYSAPGSLSHLFGQTIAKERGIKPKFVAVGNFASSRTQLMSGQVDTAHSSFPANLDLVRTGQVRVVASGDDATSLRSLSVRVAASNTSWLARNRETAARTMRAIWKGQLYAFGEPRALLQYAEHWKLDPADAKYALDYIKLENVVYAPIDNIDVILALAMEYGFLKEPLTEEQKKNLVDIIYDPKK